MKMLTRAIAISIMPFIPLAMGACSDASRDAGGESARALGSDAGLLRFIPADSPYVLVAAEPLPDDTREVLQKKSANLVAAYGNLLRVALRGRDGDGTSDNDGHPEFDAIVAGLMQLMTPEGMASAGIDRRTTLALYGYELWPVLRVSLSDEALMEATLSDLEVSAGEELPTETLDGHRYRYADGEDDLRLVAAVVDGYLVVGLLPPQPSDELLKAVLGLEPPSTSIAGSGKLADLAAAYGFTPYGLGFLDIERMTEIFLDDQSSIHGDLLADSAFDAAAVSDVCRTEVRAMAGVAPRIVTGYTEITAERIRANSVVELRGDIAGSLAALTAPVPGLGLNGHSALLTFGMSLNPQAARDFYSARLDAMESKPYQCEWFADLQAGVAAGREMLSQPWPPVMYSFRGFLASIDSLSGMDIAAGKPPETIDMRLLIATDNAEALVAMGGMFSPEIAALDLKPDARPVSLPLPVAAQIQGAYVAMSDGALAFSVGAGNEAQLPDMLAAPVSEPSPFASSDIDAAAYYGLIAEATRRRGDQDGSPELEQAVSETMTSLQALFRRISADIYLTARGIEIRSTVELAD